MKKGNKIILLMIGIGLLGSVGCQNQVQTTKELSQKDHVIQIIDTKRKGELSPLSGLTMKKEPNHQRPFAVMLDNQKKARPQAGLDQAEIIYEMLAEGMITRYMAVYYMHEPKLIGPVRSARPYFLDKAMEYDALYIHDGGSPKALEDIEKLGIADISAQSRGKDTFWRKNHKRPPHNEYTSAQAILKASLKSGYKKIGVWDPLTFYKQEQKMNGEPVNGIYIKYAKDYEPSFSYNEPKGVYERFINEAPHLDEVSKIHLSAKNIIIQRAKTKVIDNKGRREIHLTGRGDGWLLTKGEARKIIWEKTGRVEPTKFFYEDHQPIRLNKGVTWVEVINEKTKCIMQ